MPELEREPQEPDLEATLHAFLAAGFHASTLRELEAAAGLEWSAIQARYGDKEGLFYAATETSAGRPTADGEAVDAGRMLERLRAANKNPRLRAIHKQALMRIEALGEETAKVVNGKRTREGP